MSKCKKCERSLVEGEVDLCPACASEKSHKFKRVFEVVTSIVIAGGLVFIKLLRKK